jgi:uncharacterized CHY-type Zn-finger protein
MLRVGAAGLVFLQMDYASIMRRFSAKFLACFSVHDFFSVHALNKFVNHWFMEKQSENCFAATLGKYF